MSLRTPDIMLLAGLTMFGCASKLLQPFTNDSTPLMLVPALLFDSQFSGSLDYIFCNV